MIRRPPRPTRTDTLFPYTTLFRAADHNMRQPWREPVASIVAHRALFSCGAKGIGDALRCPLVIGRKGDADMAVVEDGVVLAIGLLDLIEALRAPEGAHRSEERRLGEECVSTCRTRLSPYH